MADTSGLFDAGAVAAGPGASGGATANARRVKLYSYDAMAAQALNPHGASAFTDQTTDKVWEAAARGNRKAAFSL